MQLISKTQNSKVKETICTTNKKFLFNQLNFYCKLFIKLLYKNLIFNIPSQTFEESHTRELNNGHRFLKKHKIKRKNKIKLNSSLQHFQQDFQQNAMIEKF